MLKKAGVSRIESSESFDMNYSNYPRPYRARSFLIMDNGYFYESRFTHELIEDISLDWNSFVSMGEKSREIIGDTLSEISRPGFMLHFIKKPFDEVYPQRHDIESSDGDSSTK